MTNVATQVAEFIVASVPGGERRLAHVSDAELLANTRRLVGRSNQVFAELLVHLAEVETRGLHRRRACASLYTYCIYELHFSEDAAARRAGAAKLIKKFPALFDAIAGGELHLTGILMLGPHLTPENHVDVLARARFRTKKELAKLVRELCPLPLVPDLIEPLAPAPRPLRNPTWLELVESHAPRIRDLPPGKHPRDWAKGGDASALAQVDGSATSSASHSPALARVVGSATPSASHSPALDGSATSSASQSPALDGSATSSASQSPALARVDSSATPSASHSPELDGSATSSASHSPALARVDSSATPSESHSPALARGDGSATSSASHSPALDGSATSSASQSPALDGSATSSASHSPALARVDSSATPSASHSPALDGSATSSASHSPALARVDAPATSSAYPSPALARGDAPATSSAYPSPALDGSATSSASHSPALARVDSSATSSASQSPALARGDGSATSSASQSPALARGDGSATSSASQSPALDGSATSSAYPSPALARVDTSQSTRPGPALAPVDTSEAALTLAGERELPSRRVRENLAPLTGPQQYHVQLTASEEHVALIERAKSLLARSQPGITLGELHLLGMRLLVEQLEKRSLGARPSCDDPPETARVESEPVQADAAAAGPKRAARVAAAEAVAHAERDTGSERADLSVFARPPTSGNTERRRDLPVRVKRLVNERDGARCTFVDDDGTRCAETRFLEFHHLRAFAHGGDNSAQNLTLHCRSHNALAAEDDFGCERIAQYRDSGRHERRSQVDALQRSSERPILTLDHERRRERALPSTKQRARKSSPADSDS
jgi:hypothetical protein